MNYNKLAETLDQAAFSAKPVSQISQESDLTLEEAYAIQSISIARRYVRGEKLVGLKLGFTSKAKMEQMGVHDMIWGRLTDGMQYEAGSEIIRAQFIHPRAEPEIAFKVKKDIDTVITLDNAKEYVSATAVAIEVIDSRYENFRFSLEDVVADNCSSAAFFIGEWKEDTEVQDINISLVVNDVIIHKGNSNAILGNPWESFVAAARLASQNGERLRENDIILAGAATPAVHIDRGQRVSAHAEGFGSVTMHVK
jgi:2-oxo-3-hexenedioate decarboxylase